MIPGIEHRRIRSSDGTEIAYQIRGSGPTIVLANGLGGSYFAFCHIYQALGENYRIICWDYRGIYRSQAPTDRGKLRIEDSVTDLEQILQAESVERAVFIGWSMGVQVNFEFHRRNASMMDALVVINGVSGKPFETVLHSGGLGKRAIPYLLKVIQWQSSLTGKVVRKATGWRGGIRILKTLGLASKHLDEQVFQKVCEEFGTLDWDLYCELFQNLGKHDASEQVSRVDMPTLIITGDRDYLTPPQTARAMAQTIEGSRLVQVHGGTHYIPVEFPDVVTGELRAFLSEIPLYAENCSSQ